MKSYKAVMGVMLVFMLGAASGSLATHLFTRYQQRCPPADAPRSREERLVTRLNEQLELDSLQRERVREIVHETHARISQVRMRVHPEIEALLGEGQRRINALLRPDQQEKFKRIIAERALHRRPHRH